MPAALLSYSGYYDIAIRDFGLMLGALTLGRLAADYDPPGLRRPRLATVRVVQSDAGCRRLP